MTVRLRADPWSAEYGSEVEFDLAQVDDSGAKIEVDTTIETTDWSQAVTPPPLTSLDRQPLVFVDGVRRVELRLLADDGEKRGWGLAGSFGVGAVKADGRATILETRVERILVINGGVEAPDLTARVAATRLRFRSSSIGGTDPLGPLLSLQKEMREAEGRLAASLGDEGLILADGPLIYPFGPGLRVVGVIKRMARTYLEDGPAQLLPRLQPGQRTPLFALGQGLLDRVAWYQRLVPLQPVWHELAGIVRCEMRLEVGLARGRETADHVAAALSEYGSRPGFDPRAPQNLAPVGALEQRLRHLLGHPALVRRALLTTLTEGLAAA